VIEQLAHDGSDRTLDPMPPVGDLGGHRIADLHGDGLALAKPRASVVVLATSG